MMNCFLHDHYEQYRLTQNDLFRMARTGFSGIPLAFRHFDLKIDNPHWSHTVIGTIECFPVLGGVVAVIERLTSSRFYRAPAPKPSVVDEAPVVPTVKDEVPPVVAPVKDEVHPVVAPAPQIPVADPAILFQAMTKMRRNSLKALEEHGKKNPPGLYINAGAIPSVSQLSKSAAEYKMHFELTRLTQPGKNAEFVQSLDVGLLLGVLDAHGGNEVADFGAQYVQDNFSRIYNESQLNIRETFGKMFEGLHAKVTENAAWNNIGATAVVSFIEYSTNLIFTATVANCEATIYRKSKEGRLLAIPLTCERNWSSKKDAQRVADIRRNPLIAYEWPLLWNDLREINASANSDVSRCIGLASKHPLVSSKAKITVNQLRLGDILVLSCAELRANVSEGHIVDALSRTDIKTDLVETLGKLAPKNKVKMTVLAGRILD